MKTQTFPIGFLDNMKFENNLCWDCLLFLLVLSVVSAGTVCCLCWNCLLSLLGMSVVSAETGCYLCWYCLFPLLGLSIFSAGTVCCLCQDCLFSLLGLPAVSAMTGSFTTELCNARSLRSFREGITQQLFKYFPKFLHKPRLLSCPSILDMFRKSTIALIVIFALKFSYGKHVFCDKRKYRMNKLLNLVFMSFHTNKYYCFQNFIG